ncbi:hypothetical protein L2E82_14963 [Cichorium intybus]|uniref:Uncharacterized protein n=1 Tax=Cichorium intybus TaxID=13427 RepID=A0ACB9F233_CICIN|nr:hypothetical protein L2E82_14963 [Cichorium intybus]
MTKGRKIESGTEGAAARSRPEEAASAAVRSTGREAREREIGWSKNIATRTHLHSQSGVRKPKIERDKQQIPNRKKRESREEAADSLLVARNDARGGAGSRCVVPSYKSNAGERPPHSIHLEAATSKPRPTRNQYQGGRNKSNRGAKPYQIASKDNGLEKKKVNEFPKNNHPRPVKNPLVLLNSSPPLSSSTGAKIRSVYEIDQEDVCGKNRFDIINALEDSFTVLCDHAGVINPIDRPSPSQIRIIHLGPSGSVNGN